jgi:hypothetical protein
MFAKARRLDSQIMDAWHKAANELGIRVEIPFTITGNDGRTEIYEGRVIDFGGPNGTVFAKLNDAKKRWERSKKEPYFFSFLSSNYQTYSKDLFVATLDDWKWFGVKGHEPEWYSGKNWS